MRKTFLILILAIAALATNSVMTSGVPYMTHPQPPVEQEFYWDDGIMSNGWAWYTGGNYWAVQFDDSKTGGDDTGWCTKMGAVTYPGWPDGSFQGAYLWCLDDVGGYPGSFICNEFLQFSTGGTFEWIDCDPPCELTTSVFYVAFEQWGNYPSCDAIGVDAVAGTHDWTGYNGSWGQTTAFGDFMLRCYWDGDYAVEETSWGAVKALY